MPLDHQVRDLSWKVAHGVLYTADRLISFGYQLSLVCFCGYHLECPKHLFFLRPLAQSGLDWIFCLVWSPLLVVLYSSYFYQIVFLVAS